MQLSFSSCVQFSVATVIINFANDVKDQLDLCSFDLDSTFCYFKVLCVVSCNFCNHRFCCWCRYEDDPIVGHRLYREIRKFEVKKAKARGSQVLCSATYQWETVATNFEEFQDVSVSYLNDLSICMCHV